MRSAFVIYNQNLDLNNASSYVWCEALEFIDPVGQSGERGHHQEGAHHFLFYHHGNVSDALDGLSQSHLISQDSIDAILPQHLKINSNTRVVLEKAALLTTQTLLSLS